MRLTYPGRLMLLFALLLVAVGACGKPTQPAREIAGVTVSVLPTPAAPSDAPLVRMALIPVLDILPYYIAVQNGYFDQAGIRVESVPVQGPQERDTLMQTGQVDGMLTDLISPVVFNQSEAVIKSVLTTRQVYLGQPVFRLVASPKSRVKSPADLAGKPVALAQNAVGEYLVLRMLVKSGLSPEQVVFENVPAIPVRYELLLNDKVAAAFLPDPQASGAIAAGAIAVVDDTLLPELSASNLVFSVKSLEAKPEAIRAFVESWLQAVDELNANPDKYRDLLIEKGRVPESIQGTFAMPRFPTASVPTPEQFADIVRWALEKGIIKNDVPYDRMVDTGYLP